MRRFNLIDESWIPLRFLDGSRKELGIYKTFNQAKKITAIEDSSPLVVAALYRFLLAVLYRAIQGPTDIEKAKDLFKNGLPQQKIAEYLEKWRNRFWLFDDKYPFGQIPDFEPKTWRAWTVLAAEHNADNAKVLFDHVYIEDPGTISDAAATRWILATNTFSVSSGKSELSHTGTAPSATGALVLPIGLNLEDTLLFSLIPQNRAIMADDLPLWERNPDTIADLKKGAERMISGLSDRYTWRSRSIRLSTNKKGDIEKSAFASGVKSISPDQTDPMLGYKIDEKRGRLPIQFRERGIWRDFDSILPDESDSAPRVIQHTVALASIDKSRLPPTVIIIGQANDKAKIKFWRMERFALPEAIAGDKSIRSHIRELLADAENAQKALWYTCRTFARHLLSRGNRDPTGKDLKRFIEQMPVNSWYWSALESHFHEVLRNYSLEINFEDIRYQWLKSVQKTLQTVWEQYRATISIGDAWAIRAIVKAEAPINWKLRELNYNIKLLEPSKEEE